MSLQEPVNLACASNLAYAIPLTVMLRSAVDSLSPDRELVAWIVDDGLGPSNRKRIEESLPTRARIEWLAPARSNLNGLPLWGRMPATTYHKLTIAELLPEHLRKAIWLDCDMLVLADLAELWSMPMHGSQLLAVRDTLVPTVASRFGIDAFADVGLDGSSPYFNAGMMVFDPQEWRNSHVASFAVEYLKEFHSRVFFWDQEALNAVLASRWKEVDDKWNWSATLDRLSPKRNREHANGDHRIVHFSGNIKPWVVRERMHFDSRYFEILDKTSWRGWRPHRTITRSVLGWYGSSRVRRLIYPAEHLGLRIVRRLTQRNGSRA
ncbi:MAG: glycosyltransferase family 8 protein [Gemmatimonadaceae bacterium]